MIEDNIFYDLSNKNIELTNMVNNRLEKEILKLDGQESGEYIIQSILITKWWVSSELITWFEGSSLDSDMDDGEGPNERHYFCEGP